MTEPRCNERTLHCHFEEPHEHLITDTLTCTVCGQNYQWTHRCTPPHSDDECAHEFQCESGIELSNPLPVTCSKCGQPFRLKFVPQQPAHTEDEWFVLYGRFLFATNNRKTVGERLTDGGINMAFRIGDRSEALWNSMSKAIK